MRRGAGGRRVTVGDGLPNGVYSHFSVRSYEPRGISLRDGHIILMVETYSSFGHNAPTRAEAARGMECGDSDCRPGGPSVVDVPPRRGTVHSTLVCLQRYGLTVNC